MDFQIAPAQEKRPSGFVPDNDKTRIQREKILAENEDQLAEAAHQAHKEKKKRKNVTHN